MGAEGFLSERFYLYIYCCLMIAFRGVIDTGID